MRFALVNNLTGTTSPEVVAKWPACPRGWAAVGANGVGVRCAAPETARRAAGTLARPGKPAPAFAAGAAAKSQGLSRPFGGSCDPVCLQVSS